MWWNPHYTYFEKQHGQIIPPDTPTTHWKCIVENGCSRILYDPYGIPIIWWWGISCILFSYFGGHPPPPSRFRFSTRGGDVYLWAIRHNDCVERESRPPTWSHFPSTKTFDILQTERNKSSRRSLPPSILVPCILNLFMIVGNYSTIQTTEASTAPFLCPNPTWSLATTLRFPMVRWNDKTPVSPPLAYWAFGLNREIEITRIHARLFGHLPYPSRLLTGSRTCKSMGRRSQVTNDWLW